MNSTASGEKSPSFPSGGLSRVRIVGSGLIGTSIALGLVQRGVSVQMVDSDPLAQALATDLIGSEAVADPQLVILALPTVDLGAVLEWEYQLNPHSTFMDVGSVKSEVQVKVEGFPKIASQFVPTHPMAGREIGGAAAARADLFVGRSWAVTPTPATESGSLEIVEKLIDLMGATSVHLSAKDHDAAVAKISHLPQIISSLLGKQLLGTKPEWLELAGAGLRDTTRIASSDENLWKEIIYSNREALSHLLTDIQSDLHQMILALNNSDQIGLLLGQGRAGRELIPGKHGGKAREYSFLPIVIDDKPGQLASIFNECANLAVNVEDLNIEHSPGQLSALITLALSANDAQRLSVHLVGIGWNVHPIRN